MIQLNNSWTHVLEPQIQMPYMKELEAFLNKEYAHGKIIYPEKSNIFKALDLTNHTDVRVVILGQDPYHGDGQAHGLSFSVPKGIKPPPSLINIYKELETDIGITRPMHGHLENWAKQGVLLLNSVLTVEKAQANSHKGKGWETFTDAIIKEVNKQEKPVVFMLWGAYAQKKVDFLDRNKHLILKAPHPSPLSAHRGFLGCKHFSQANTFLQANKREAIDWQL